MIRDLLHQLERTKKETHFFVAPTLRARARPRFGALLQRHALAPPATDRLAPVAMSRP